MSTTSLPSTSSSSSSRSSSGFRNLPNQHATVSPRLVFTTLTPKDLALGPYAHPSTGKPMHLFTLDDYMVYTPFKNDHGPLNLAYTFDACVRIFDKLNAKDYKRKALCLYTSPSPEQKSNVALIAALYSLIVDHQDPWDAFQPLAHFEVLPFRDAGNGVNEFGLTIQDVLYGMWKARQHDLLNLQEFDADDYRYFERVENGDLNILGSFIAFASPMDPAWITAHAQPGEIPQTFTSSQTRMLASAFDKVTSKFFEEDVGLVVRLNDELYNKSRFTDANIEHVDLYFDDGTNPTNDIVRQFIALADDMINNKKRKVAVHCKAGLGRTGVLIGAYLIYKYQFSASEVIGFMRIIRPGMVVGPQQRYMQLNQMKWAGWAVMDAAAKNQGALSLPSPPMNPKEALPATEPTDTPRPLTPARRVTATSSKHGDAIGQPRKGPNGNGVQEGADDMVTPGRQVKSTAPSPSSADSQDGSVRGIKRGSGRSPVPHVLRGEAAQPVVTAVPIRTGLARSVSSASCSSTVSELDQRATKRRQGDAVAKSGLSSPPPSRETTPSDGSTPPTSSFPIEETPEPLTTPRQTLSQLSSRPETPPTISARADGIRPVRSLIPCRGTVLNKDGIAVSSPPHSPSRMTRSKSTNVDGQFADADTLPTSSSTGSISARMKLPSSRLIIPAQSWQAVARMGAGTNA
ncbi:Tyrosine-protein phosphatase CDC14 [Vanrija pseudolonga]|uniref:protein-tyrosine-phosphatase n=1 Tax=Vanrija pseudolonga TaxID=143232 RepID=A0AAF0YJI3_9TREE|nr:Tyrosine-protein phosphatase CDC14 [Vanrija pseudolonga]